MSNRLGLTIPVEEVLDPVLWRDRFLWGTALATSRGVVGDQVTTLHISAEDRAALTRYVGNIPDHVIVWHLRAALSELSEKLDYPMETTIVKGTPVDTGLVRGRDYDVEMERMAWSRESAESFYRLQVPGPIISIQRIRLYSADAAVLDVSSSAGNMSLINITDKKTGTIHLLPYVTISGTVSSSTFLTVDRSGVVQPALDLRRGFSNSSVPDSWSIDYIRGPIAENGIGGHIEAQLAQWVGAYVAKNLINLSSAIRSALSSSSVSIDGVSQSIGLTASAMYSITSALEKVYQDTTKGIDWVAMRRRKKGMPIYFL